MLKSAHEYITEARQEMSSKSDQHPIDENIEFARGSDLEFMQGSFMDLAKYTLNLPVSVKNRKVSKVYTASDDQMMKFNSVQDVFPFIERYGFKKETKRPKKMGATLHVQSWKMEEGDGSATLEIMYEKSSTRKISGDPNGRIRTVRLTLKP